MGPNKEPQEELIICGSGERFTRGEMTAFPEVKLDCSRIEPQFPTLICADEMSLSIMIKPTRGLRRTSRKRFVKLLMSYGWSRNRATKIVLAPEQHGQTYQNLFFHIWLTDLIRGRKDKE